MADAISVYSDATALREPLIGAWAFRIPEINVARTGIAEGLFNTDLEMVGAVAGVCFAAEHVQGRTINVCTDEHGVHSWIHELRLRIAGKTKRNGGRPSRAGSQTRVLAELHRLSEVMRTREVMANLVSSDQNKDHEFCHNLCRRALRDHLLRDRPDLIVQFKKLTNPIAYARAVQERQRCLNRAAELTRWLANEGF